MMWVLSHGQLNLIGALFFLWKPIYKLAVSLFVCRALNVNQICGTNCLVHWYGGKKRKEKKTRGMHNAYAYGFKIKMAIPKWKVFVHSLIQSTRTCMYSTFRIKIYIYTYIVSDLFNISISVQFGYVWCAISYRQCFHFSLYLDELQVTATKYEKKMMEPMWLWLQTIRTNWVCAHVWANIHVYIIVWHISLILLYISAFYDTTNN